MNSEEEVYLSNVLKIINKQIDNLDKSLSDDEKAISEQKEYIWSNIYEMDTIEKAANVDILMAQEDSKYRNIQERKGLKRMLRSPYFGKIVFSYDDDPEDMAETFYIGVRSLADEDMVEYYVYDWRAPVSSMFYEYEEGEASYIAPQGVFNGKLRKKRQFKIENGKLIYVFDSSLKINDEILQETLSHSTDNKMKNIVSTIQKEQNKIIRSANDGILVVQGVAGSGKTSIALHRIAYLLYAYKDTIKSYEVLIISPNKVFTNYISNVLPELGESKFNEMCFDDLIYGELGNTCRVENRFDALEYVIKNVANKTDRIYAIEYKASIEFYDAMTAYFDKFIDGYVRYADVKVGEVTIPAKYIKKMYEREYVSSLPYVSRFDEIAYKIVNDELYGLNVGITERKISDKLKSVCLLKTNILEIYNDFLISLNGKYGIEPLKRSNVRYEDAFPLVYFKFMLYGRSETAQIKHVVVDEMQDYSPVQFAIIKKMFSCPMTILGDVNQVIKRSSEDVLSTLKHVYENTNIIRVNKTYRSTEEITKLANSIISLNDVEMFSRHGKTPQIKKVRNKKAQWEAIFEKRCMLNASGYHNIAIICRDANHSKLVFDKMSELVSDEIVLFTKDSREFCGGTIVISSYLSKGLEFDAVIIPDVDNKLYNSDVDRQILYISCTRALHDLYMTHVGERTVFLNL